MQALCLAESKYFHLFLQSAAVIGLRNGMNNKRNELFQIEQFKIWVRAKRGSRNKKLFHFTGFRRLIWKESLIIDGHTSSIIEQSRFTAEIGLIRLFQMKSGLPRISNFTED